MVKKFMFAVIVILVILLIVISSNKFGDMASHQDIKDNINNVKESSLKGIGFVIFGGVILGIIGVIVWVLSGSKATNGA